MERGILHRLGASIPIISPALGVLIEHTEMGIAQLGLVLGLLRGLLVGLVLCASLIILSEAVLFSFDIFRNCWEVNLGAKLKSDQRVAATKQSDEDSAALLIHHGSGAVIRSGSARCYLIAKDRVGVSDVDGSTLGPLDWLEAQDPGLFVRQPATVNGADAITPFFFGNSTRDVVTLTDNRRQAKYVVASLGLDQLVLIPVKDYANANLPMHEGGR